MQLTFSELIGFLAILIAVAGYLNTRYGMMADFQKQVGCLDARLSKTEIKLDIIMPAITDAVKEMLKAPTHLRKDYLLEKFPDLSSSELKELKLILECEKSELMPIVKQEKLSTDKKVYLIALGLMLAGIDTRLVDVRAQSGFKEGR